MHRNTKKYLQLNTPAKAKKSDGLTSSSACKVLLLKANPKSEKVIEGSIDGPRYFVVTTQKDFVEQPE